MYLQLYFPAWLKSSCATSHFYQSSLSAEENLEPLKLAFKKRPAKTLDQTARMRAVWSRVFAERIYLSVHFLMSQLSLSYMLAHFTW